MAPVHVAQLLAHPAVRSAIERALAARGTHGDTQLIHADPREEAMLRMMGGVGTINPRTGLRQFYGSDVGGPDTTDVGGPGNIGGGVGAAADAAARAGGGVGGGYGHAGDTHSSLGSGAGYGGGHSGQNYYSQTYGGHAGGPGGGYTGPPLAQAPAINNMPIAAPVSLTPMMSDTATTDLTGGRFGALPSWATTPYQIGTAPSSYPTPGVNAGLGAPGYAGNPLLGQAVGGGGGGGGGGGSSPAPGAPGGPLLNPDGTVPAGVVQNLGGQQAVLRQAAGQSGEGYQGTWADAFNQANHNIMAQQAGLNTGPTTTLGVLLQMLGGPAPAVAAGSPRNTGAVAQAALAGPAMGGQALRQPVQQPVRLAAAPVAPARAPLAAPAKTPQSLMQQMAALNAARTIGANRW